MNLEFPSSQFIYPPNSDSLAFSDITKIFDNTKTSITPVHLSVKSTRQFVIEHRATSIQAPIYQSNRTKHEIMGKGSCYCGKVSFTYEGEPLNKVIAILRLHDI